MRNGVSPAGGAKPHHVPHPAAVPAAVCIPPKTLTSIRYMGVKLACKRNIAVSVLDYACEYCVIAWLSYFMLECCMNHSLRVQFFFSVCTSNLKALNIRARRRLRRRNSLHLVNKCRLVRQNRPGKCRSNTIWV